MSMEPASPSMAAHYGVKEGCRESPLPIRYACTYDANNELRFHEDRGQVMPQMAFLQLLSYTSRAKGKMPGLESREIGVSGPVMAR